MNPSSPSAFGTAPEAPATRELRALAARIAGELDALAATSLTPAQNAHIGQARAGVALLLETALALGEKLAGTGADLPGGAGLPVIREEIIEELRDESPELLEHLIQLFSGSARQTVIELTAAVQAREGKVIAQRTHHLKGSASNFGAERLMALCQAMEEKVRRNDLGGIEALLERLHEEYDRVVATLGACLGVEKKGESDIS